MKTVEVILITLLVIFSLQIEAKEYHVSVDGDDNAKGSLTEPFRTISVAANIAQSGDTITVHEGVYRERVNPLNGGFNDLNRIVYQAAQEEKVIIKGSEIISDWKKVEGSVWKAVIPNTLFKDYNPYSDFLTGDWLNKKGVDHHTGEVFLNGKSLF